MPVGVDEDSPLLHVALMSMIEDSPLEHLDMTVLDSVDSSDSMQFLEVMICDLAILVGRVMPAEIRRVGLTKHLRCCDRKWVVGPPRAYITRWRKDLGVGVRKRPREER